MVRRLGLRPPEMLPNGGSPRVTPSSDLLTGISSPSETAHKMPDDSIKEDFGDALNERDGVNGRRRSIETVPEERKE